MIGDAQWMLEELRRGPATTMELIERSKAERGVGLTPHTRASDLRKRGCDVQVTRRPTGLRPVYVYRLVSEPEDAGVVDPPARVEQEPRLVPPAVAPLDAPIPGQLEMAL